MAGSRTRLSQRGSNGGMGAPMKRVKIGFASVGLLVGSALVGASCGAGQGSADVPPAVTVTAPPTAAPTASPTATSEPVEPKVDMNDPAQVSAASWTDDEVIAALAKDCHWDPGGCFKAIAGIAGSSVDVIEFLPEDGEQPATGRTLPKAVCQNVVGLACARVPGQTCVPDGCSQSDYDCYPKCDGECATCGDKCATACETCKAPCKDDACRLECAKSCGECRNKCLQDLDHCTSTVCPAAEETCYKERDDRWNSSTCERVCPKVQTCVEKCPPIENDYTGELYYSPCAKKCLKSFGKGCPEEFDFICAGSPNHSVNFNVYHVNRKAEEEANKAIKSATGGKKKKK